MPVALAPLLAQTTAHQPTGWTDKEIILYVLTAVGGTLSVVIPVAWGLVKILARNAERRAAKLEAENRALKRSGEGLGDAPSVKDLRERLDEKTKAYGHLEVTVAQVRA